MKSQEQIIDRLKSIKKNDILGFRTEALVDFLTKEKAETLRGDIFKENAEFKGWEKPDLSDDAVKKRAKEYLAFAFDKALNHRGISASRSVEKLKEWLWLIGLDDQVDWENYQNYGCPILRQVAKALKVEGPKDSAFDRMARGLPCQDDCEEGCDRQ